MIFPDGYPDQLSPEEGWSVQLSKHSDNNNKCEDNNLNVNNVITDIIILFLLFVITVPRLFLHSLSRCHTKSNLFWSMKKIFVFKCLRCEVQFPFMIPVPNIYWLYCRANLLIFLSQETTFLEHSVKPECIIKDSEASILLWFIKCLFCLTLYNSKNVTAMAKDFLWLLKI